MPQARLPTVAAKTEFLDADGRYDPEAKFAYLDRLDALDLEERITERTYWSFEGRALRVDIVDDIRGFYWRLVVNESASDWTSHYQGILAHEGFAVVTEFYEGSLEAMRPFRIAYAQED